MFCKYCYQEGEFTQKDIFVVEMKRFVKWVFLSFLQ
ncbi:zinc ribbon domain-containing protein [Lysinibacillus xylanilyticus]